MSKTLLRLIVVLLIPCLVMDPVLASMSVGSREQTLTQSQPASTFSQQALIERLDSALFPGENDTAVHLIRHRFFNTLVLPPRITKTLYAWSQQYRRRSGNPITLHEAAATPAAIQREGELIGRLVDLLRQAEPYEGFEEDMTASSILPFSMVLNRSRGIRTLSDAEKISAARYSYFAHVVRTDNANGKLPRGTNLQHELLLRLEQRHQRLTGLASLRSSPQLLESLRSDNYEKANEALLNLDQEWMDMTEPMVLAAYTIALNHPIEDIRRAAATDILFSQKDFSPSLRAKLMPGFDAVHRAASAPTGGLGPTYPRPTDKQRDYRKAIADPFAPEPRVRHHPPIGDNPNDVPAAEPGPREIATQVFENVFLIDPALSWFNFVILLLKESGLKSLENAEELAAYYRKWNYGRYNPASIVFQMAANPMPAENLKEVVSLAGENMPHGEWLRDHAEQIEREAFRVYQRFNILLNQAFALGDPLDELRYILAHQFFQVELFNLASSDQLPLQAYGSAIRKDFRNADAVFELMGHYPAYSNDPDEWTELLSQIAFPTHLLKGQMPRTLRVSGAIHDDGGQATLWTRHKHIFDRFPILRAAQENALQRANEAIARIEKLRNPGSPSTGSRIASVVSILLIAGVLGLGSALGGVNGVPELSKWSWPVNSNRMEQAPTESPRLLRRDA